MLVLDIEQRIHTLMHFTYPIDSYLFRRVEKNGGFWVLLLLLIYSSSLTRLHDLGQYRVNEEEGVKLRKIGNDLTSMVFDSE